MQTNTISQNENLKKVTHSRLMTGRLCMPTGKFLLCRAFKRRPFCNSLAMREGHPLKADTFLVLSVRDTSCFTHIVIMKYFFLLTKVCVQCWGSGVKERNSVFWCSLSRLLDVTDCQEVLAEMKCLEQHVLDCAFSIGKLLASRNHPKLCPCPQSWTQIQRDDSLKNRKTEAEGSLTGGILSGHKVGKWS